MIDGESQTRSDSDNAEEAAANQPRRDIDADVPEFPYRDSNTTKKPSRKEDLRFYFEIIAVLFGLITLILLGVQSYQQERALTQQKQASETENAIVREEIEAQATQSAEELQQLREIDNINRRATLLEIIYKRRDCDADNIDECPLEASTRVRTEAALAFVEIERERGEQPDLTGVDLRSGILSRADLKGVVLSQAILSDTILINVDLGGAILYMADLSGADLRGAKLNNIDLRFTNLRGTNLGNADLSSADLNVSLLSRAIYNKGTIWPDDFDYTMIGTLVLEEEVLPLMEAPPFEELEAIEGEEW